MDALVAVHAMSFPPLDPWQVHGVDPPAAGSAGEDGLAAPTVQYAPEGNEAPEEYPVAAGPHMPFTGELLEHDGVHTS